MRTNKQSAVAGSMMVLLGFNQRLIIHHPPAAATASLLCPNPWPTDSHLKSKSMDRGAEGRIGGGGGVGQMRGDERGGTVGGSNRASEQADKVDPLLDPGR